MKLININIVDATEVLPSYQSRIIEESNQSRIKEQAKCTCVSVEKLFEK